MPKPTIAVLWWIALLAACNRTVEGGFGDLDPSVTTDEASSSTGDAGESSNMTADDAAPPDVGAAEPTETSASPSACGNGTIDGDEDCDGDDIDSETCMTWGFLAGEIACNDDCTIDTSACLSESVCGDGIVSGDEDCEGMLRESCASSGLGTGSLTCADDCHYDAGACTCRGAGEACYVDWTDPGGQSNCCPPGFKGIVQGACGAGSMTCH